jgi:epoxyqueuosine reductase
VDPARATQLFVDEARALGFVRVGVAAVGEVARYDVYRDWLAQGHAADMRYLASQAAERRDPRALLPSARTVVTVAMSYAQRESSEASSASRSADHGQAPSGGTVRIDVPRERLTRGFIARYARGDDYHVVLGRRLRTLAEAVATKSGRAVACLPAVDTRPVLEREWASAGGIGFQAKNTMLIAPGLGSYLLLGEIITDLECAPLPTHDAQPRCGQCTRCLEACPTGAFVAPYTLDSRRCIAYLTIENTGPIPRELRPLVGERVFGCDVCQEVCPFNAAEHEGTPELAPRPGYAHPSLVQLLGLGAAQFRKWQRGSALRRIHRPQLLRNVAVALGNVGTLAEVPPLMQALGEPSPLVRVHVAWALAAIVTREPLPSTERAVLAQFLDAALAREDAAAAREELAAARAVVSSAAPRA